MEMQRPEDRIRQLQQLFATAGNGKNSAVAWESLLDTLLVLYNECNSSVLRREKNVLEFLEFARPVTEKIKSLLLRRDEFETLNVIGRGAFGEVSLVKLKSTERVYAMKTLNKWEMLKRAETACFKEERDVLAFGDKRWVTKLHYSFQDERNLYFLMDYYSGGDLLTLISKYEDHLPEHMAKFYLAEMILAIDSLHKMSYVHRDIKPDNVLIDVSGNIRLADFGSCLKIGDDGYVHCAVAVGTPDYISPEILQAMEEGKGRYGRECDWWSLGICMYEMLYGETPFYAESLVETYGKIMDHKTKFQFPDDYDISDDAKNLMKKLVCVSSERLGNNGVDDFRPHSFFEGIDWENILESTPPYMPEVSSPTDVSNFDVDDLMEPRAAESAPPPTHQAFTGHHLPFIGFTYFGERSTDLQISQIRSPEAVRHDPEGAPSMNDRYGDSSNQEKKITELERQKADLNRKLRAAESARINLELKFSSNTTPDSVKKLEHEINALKRKLTESDEKQEKAEKEIKEIGRARKELDVQRDELSVRIRELEKANKTLSLEKNGLENELSSFRDKASSFQKELKDIHAQRKTTMGEFSELNDKLAEVRSHKLKLTRLVHEKEEEIENMLNKNDQTRQELRGSEKKRRELIAQVEEIQADLHKEQKLRAKSEQQVQKLQESLDNVQSQHFGGRSAVSTNGGPDVERELERLRGELDMVKDEQEGTITKERVKFSKEIKELKARLAESESNAESWKTEVSSLKAKLDSIMEESSNHDQEYIAELRKQSDRDRALLMEENRKLTAEMERLMLNSDKGNARVKQLEEELRDFAEKREAVTHWEEQIAEIIQWVSDEKDARGYLQALASKMSEELEHLKVSGLASGPAAAKNWQTRRSQRMDKQELLSLQANLKMEVQAKNHLSEELNKVKMARLEAERKLTETESDFSSIKAEVEKLKSENESLKARGTQGNLPFLNFFQNSGDASFDLSVDNETDDSFESISRTSSTSVSKNVPVSQSTTSPPAAAQPERAMTSVSPAGAPRKVHKFVAKTYPSPTKCHHCMSVMFGHVRQGMICDACGYSSHVGCTIEAPQTCPVPQNLLSNRPLGIDPKKGTGTAYEGFVRVPKPGGVKRGWMKAFAVVCDFKIVFYDVSGVSQISNTMLQVVDMRDEEFSVSTVAKSDVIHANERDVPCIFKITISELNQPETICSQLLLAENEQSARKWVSLLHELKKVLDKTEVDEPKHKYHIREVCDATDHAVVKMTQCAAIVDSAKIVFGTEEGLFSLDLTAKQDAVSKIGDARKVFQVEVISDEQLVVVISGRGRHVRLYPLVLVSGHHDLEPIKIAETKGAVQFATGSFRQGSATCMCVTTKKHVFLYELNRTKERRRKFKDFPLTVSAQWAAVSDGRVLLGYPSGFSMLDIHNNNAQLQKLINPEDQTLSFITTMNSDALLAVEVKQNEFLLCFAELAFYVNEKGFRSRQTEIAWPTPITHLAFSAPHVVVYSERGIDIFNASTAEWLQTLSIRRCQPLCRSGSLNICSGFDQLSILYLRNIESESQELSIYSSKGKRAVSRFLKMKKKKGAWNKRESFRTEEADMKEKLISLPSNFTHVTHMGPGDGKMILKDLPEVKEQAQNSPIGRAYRSFSQGPRARKPQQQPPAPAVNRGAGQAGAARPYSVAYQQTDATDYDKDGPLRQRSLSAEGMENPESFSKIITTLRPKTTGEEQRQLRVALELSRKQQGYETRFRNEVDSTSTGSRSSEQSSSYSDSD
ncbi:serine/threonine-protein kinase MRCK alpha-like isoform X1 [Rhopilema esculentum]|uniref:serine/threonine-protein kinase MRCK alpha-like isoform X1 n=1 Tax=Rhopilema esculentum TaxID=499914 RepID=UPI0031D2EF72